MHEQRDAGEADDQARDRGGRQPPAEERAVHQRDPEGDDRHDQRGHHDLDQGEAGLLAGELLADAFSPWGGYGGFGVEGLDFPYHGAGATAAEPNLGLSQCHGCATEDVVTPHASFIALDVAPQEAYANIATLRSQFPGVYGANGFFDAVNPTTGVVGHRILALDQSMIMASLDNALRNRALQRHFAADPVSWAAREYLSMETMSLP